MLVHWKKLLLAVFACQVITGASLRAQLTDVSRDTSATISNGEADSIIAQIDSKIQVAPGTCLLTLHRDSDISSFSVSGGTIGSDADMAAVCQQPGYFKVVNVINYCGTIGANIIGCSYKPGSCSIIVRYDPALEWMLWAHEYGHSKGLGHREDPDAVMNHLIDPAHVSMTALECAMLQNTASAGPQGPPIASTPTRPRDVRDFVHQRWIEGVPYLEAGQFSDKDVDALLSMLNDPAERPFWGTIAATLGMTKKARVIQPLIRFVKRKDALADWSTLRARSAAIIGLGYLASVPEGGAARRFIAAHASRDAWAHESLDWAIPSHSDESRNAELMKVSILALALSGNAEARTQLEHSAAHEKDAKTSALIRHALQEHEKIARLGLSGYYTSRGKGSFEWKSRIQLPDSNLRDISIQIAVVTPVDTTLRGELLIEPDGEKPVNFATFEIVSKADKQQRLTIENAAIDHPTKANAAYVIFRGTAVPPMPEDAMVMHGITSSRRK